MYVVQTIKNLESSISPLDISDEFKNEIRTKCFNIINNNFNINKYIFNQDRTFSEKLKSTQTFLKK